MVRCSHTNTISTAYLWVCWEHRWRSLSKAICVCRFWSSSSTTFTYPGQRELSVSHQTNASPQSLKYEAADSTGGYTGQFSQYSQPYHRPPASLVEGAQDFSSPCFTPFRSPSEQEGSFGSSGLLTGSSHREDSLAGKIGHSGSTISNHSQASSHWQPASIRDRPADTKEQLPVSMHCERLFSGKPVHW